MRIKRKGLTLTIFEDTIEDPREYYKDTNVGRMVCWHRRYKLGDEHDFKNPQEFQKWIKECSNQIACVLPLYLLDHSELAMSTHSFMDPWDSGQVGYIYCTKKSLEQHGYSKDGNPEFVKSLLEDEVEEYHKWLSGYPPYYSFEITDENDNCIECEGVFKGEDFKQMIEEMKTRSENKYNFLFDSLLERESNCL